MGTPAYMAPEQCRGVGVEARTDLYSLGVILYEMFAGRTPFQGSFVELITKHLSDPPEAPSHFGQVPPSLERLIMSCLEKEPARRPASAASLARELEAALVASPAVAAKTAAAAAVVAAGDTLSPLPGTTSPGATMVPARTRAPLVWIGGVGAVALAVVLFLVLARQPAHPDPGPAALTDSASQPAAPAPAPAAAAATGHVRVVAQNASNARFFIDDRLVASGAREADLPSVTPDRPHLLRVEADGLTPAERPSRSPPVAWSRSS
jgi:hypothetical protein